MESQQQITKEGLAESPGDERAFQEAWSDILSDHADAFLEGFHGKRKEEEKATKGICFHLGFCRNMFCKFSLACYYYHLEMF